MLVRRGRRPTTARLSALRDRIEGWRRQRDGKRARIPEELWAAAVDVARVEGVHPTSKALRLDYYDLKGRVDRMEHVAETETPTFIELEPDAVRGCSRKAIVEIQGPRRDRMRIEVSGASTVELAALARALWRNER
jgi:hypothetical protein